MIAAINVAGVFAFSLVLPKLGPGISKFVEDLILAGAYLLYFQHADTQEKELSNMRFWTIATTVGMLFQWLIQVPSLRKLGWRFRLIFPPTHPGVFEMLVLMAPAVISQSVMQVNFLINQFFGGRLATMPLKLTSDDGANTVIRFVTEKLPELTTRLAVPACWGVIPP